MCFSASAKGRSIRQILFNRYGNCLEIDKRDRSVKPVQVICLTKFDRYPNRTAPAFPFIYLIIIVAAAAKVINS